MSQADGNPLFDILAKLDITLGNVDRATKQQSQLIQRAAQAREAEVPRFIRIHGQTLLNANGFGVIGFDLAGPDMGHFWYVTVLSIGSGTVSTPVAGRADVFVSAMDLRTVADLATLGIGDWQCAITALPNVEKVGRGEIELRLNELLFVVISGGTPAQVVTCSGTIIDYEEAKSRQDWAM